ncbi:MAG: ExbD/TolR family protein [Limisphaerales bacterium]
MKFQRRAKIFRGQLDVAPFAAVFFLMLCFFMMGSLLYTPGVTMQVTPPVADGFSGTDNPTITMAVTASGQFLFDNRVLEEADLKSALMQKVSAAPKSSQGLTLVVIPDKTVTYEVITKIRSLARDAGISEVLEAVTPSAYSMKAK